MSGELAKYAWSGRFDDVYSILVEGANVNEQDPKTGWTALAAAAYKNRIEIAQLLLDYHADTSIRGNEGDTALMWATQNKLPDMADLLLSRGAQVNITNKWGDSPLWIAASTGCLPVVKILLARGANPNITNKWGHPVLTGAFEFTEVTKALLVYGANPNVSLYGESLLMRAMCDNRADLVKILLDHGVDVNSDLTN